MKSTIIGCFFLVFATLASTLYAEKAEKPEGKEIEFFTALDAGDVDVRVITRSEKKITVLIENKTDKPLRIRLPDAFGAVPVLAQMDNLFNNQQANNGNKQSQPVGAGQPMQMGQQQNPFGDMFGQQQRGLFNLEPAQVRKIRAPGVCLEHGLPTPNSRMKYRICPLDKATECPEIVAVCRLLGQERIEQPVAQALTWHYTNEKTWEELPKLVKVQHHNGRKEYFFTKSQVEKAQKLDEKIKKWQKEAQSLSKK